MSSIKEPPQAPGRRVEAVGLDRTALWVLVVCCAASLVPLWSVTYPPMVDLAQHAAQTATWHRWGEGGFDYGHYLRVNWYTPYVVANAVAAALSTLLSVAVAFKLVLSAAILGVPLVTLALIREAGGNPLWALLVVPAGYGFAFYMGFVSFAFAVPMALVFVLLAWRYAETPTRRRAWTLLGLSQALFLTHVIAFGWAGLSGALLVAQRSPRWKATLRRWWPFLAALALPACWLFYTVRFEDLDPPPRSGSGSYGWSRLLQIVSFAAGMPVNDVYLLLGLVLWSIPFVIGGRPSRDRGRWIPFLTTLVLFLVTPNWLMGTAHLHQRFAIFFFPTLLFALDPRVAVPRPRQLGYLVAGATVWLSLVQVQFLAFRAEVGAFGELLDVMEPNRYVLYLPLDWSSESIPYPVFLHFGCWYQVEKGGLVDYSFAELFPNRFRYREDARPRLESSAGVRWQPGDFDWRRHGGERYGYFLVRWPERPDILFRRAGAPVVPVASASGGWWLYEPAEGARASSSSARFR